jgi:hypothetical protein
MRLIGLAVVLALSLLAAPLAPEAQQAGKIARIGVLGSGALLDSRQPYRRAPAGTSRAGICRRTERCV